MDGVSTSSSEARDAVLRYEAFLNDVLKRDLALVQARREREEEALEAYAKLKGVRLKSRPLRLTSKSTATCEARAAVLMCTLSTQ